MVIGTSLSDAHKLKRGIAWHDCGCRKVDGLLTGIEKDYGERLGMDDCPLKWACDVATGVNGESDGQDGKFVSHVMGLSRRVR